MFGALKLLEGKLEPGIEGEELKLEPGNVDEGGIELDAPPVIVVADGGGPKVEAGAVDAGG